MIGIDLRSMTITSGIIFLIFFAQMFYFRIAFKGARGFLLWAFGAASCGIGLTLLGLRYEIPDFLSLTLGNILIIGYMTLVYLGMARFLEYRVNWRLHLLALFLAGVGFFSFTIVHASVHARAVVSCGWISFYSCKCCVLMRRSKYYDQVHNPFLSAGFLVQGLYALILLVYAVFFKPELTPTKDMGPVHVMGLLFLVLISGVILTSLIFLNLKRISLEMREAEEEVRRLKGLLPICSHCKKIRDTKGEWQNLEGYIRRHSDAEFTHSLCPDCIKELYPEISLED